jgi:hypothetical protein
MTIKLTTLSTLVSTLLLSLAAGSASAITVTANNNATALANALGGSGITISDATLVGATDQATGTFANGGAIGFDKGVLLTTGTVACAPGPNTQTNCGGGGAITSLKFNFTSDSGDVFFKYVFASEEYNEYVGGGFNDIFELRLNGMNIALLPGTAGVVSIDNVNNGINSGYYRDNNLATIDTQYDGLTTVLTARAFGLTGLNTFEFLIRDNGDSSLDSGVFIEAGTFSSQDPTDVPEPGSLALLGLGLAGLGAAKRRKA